MSRPFEVRRDVDLPATPDEVWAAMTARTSAYQFPTGMEVAPGETPPDGSPFKVWEPGRHLVVRFDAPDGTYNQLEYLIEARDGGTAHLHYVHSGILAEEWADQYDAIGPHTDFYLHTLGQYLAHFAPAEATYVGQPSAGIEGPESAGGPEAMETLRAALGLGDGAAAGDPATVDLGAAGTITGEIDYLTPQFIGIRTADGMYRFFGRNHFGGVVGMSAHLFGEGHDAAALEAAMREWLGGVFA